MVYSIEERGGRFVVISPKGKKWKTTYASRAAAEKGVAYVEGRFGGSGSSAKVATSAETGMVDVTERHDPIEGERGTKTLIRLRTLQDEEVF